VTSAAVATLPAMSVSRTSATLLVLCAHYNRPTEALSTEMRLHLETIDGQWKNARKVYSEGPEVAGAWHNIRRYAELIACGNYRHIVFIGHAGCDYFGREVGRAIGRRCKLVPESILASRRPRYLELVVRMLRAQLTTTAGRRVTTQAFLVSDNAATRQTEALAATLTDITPKVLPRSVR
jgi:hypothetical protein